MNYKCTMDKRELDHKWTITMTVLSAILLLVSCKGETGKAMLKTAANPAIAYRSYLLDIRSRTELSTPELASELRRWQVLDDSISVHLQRDTLSFNSDTRNECDLLHDSVRTEFCRLALTRPRTYNDIIHLKECLSPYLSDEELLLSVDEIEPFFEGVSRQTPFSGNCEQAIKAYREVLRRTLGKGIHGTDDLTLFIRQEDAIFRAFLTHLNELGQMNVSDITRDTERCCMQVFQAAEREELSYKEAMIYLAMRTNRRLLLNVRQCADDIRSGKVKTAEQAQAYLWMLLQPYTSLDAFGVALLTLQERQILHQATIDTPDLIDRLCKNALPDNGHLDNIPSLLVQAYISTL